MYNDDVLNELARLKFEDYLFLFYGSIIITNILGNYYEKEYLKTDNRIDKIKYNSIFEIIFILTFFIYLYLFVRNYNNYRKAAIQEKRIYLVRVLGAVFLIVGIICFIYFQDYQRRK